MRVVRIGISTAVLVSLMSCSMFGSDASHIDYGAAAAKLPTLDLPPDLTTPLGDPRFKMPDATAGNATTFSDYSNSSKTRSAGAVGILPDIPGVRLKHNGTQRWLVINDRAENVWPIIKTFWQQSGLEIRKQDREAGVMETGWYEIKALLPKYDYSNNNESPLDDDTYVAGERDQYTTRLERSQDGASTEVYISQRGMVEIFSTDRKIAKWQADGNDPEKEAIMLQRLMVRFGGSQQRALDELAENQSSAAASSVVAVATVAASAVAAAGPTTISAPELPGSAVLREISGGSTIIVMNDTFDRSWRKVGLAIENAGLGVEDKDREKGIYYLRPIKIETGWLDKLKFWKSNVDTSRHYRVIVKDGGTSCEVSVTDQSGASNKASGEMLDGIYKTVSKQ